MLTTLVAPLARALFICVSLIGIGYLCRRCGYLSPVDAAGLSAFVARLSLPGLLFLSMAQLDLSATDWPLLGALCLTKAIIFVATVMLCYASSSGTSPWLCRAGL